MSPRLLVLDDDVAILTLLGSYFGGLGWRVDVCAEAPRGLDLLESDAFDAVICDLHLGPGCNGEGIDIITWVRQRRPDAALVLFTAAFGDGVRTAALRAGADDVIAKPAPLTRLRDAAVRAMKKP